SDGEGPPMAETVCRAGRAAGRTRPPPPGRARRPAGPPPAVPASPPADRPRRWERAALAAMALGLLAFGGLVELRSAFQQTSKTDFGVYARAAWAVRAGADPYAVTDSNGWHYCYPPPPAILLAPLADPPPGEGRAGYLPFAASVALWYVFGVACIFWASHRMAAAVLPGEPAGSRRWWYARV